MNLKSLYIAITICFLVINASYAQQKLIKPVQVKTDEPFGLVFNHNGDLSFASANPTEAQQLLKKTVDYIHSLDIKTLVYSVGASSDVLYYPTKVANTLGWRATKSEQQNVAIKIKIENARACLSAGMDAIKTASIQAKKNNMLFIPSLRMNDSRFTFDPQNSPYTSKFWLDNTNLAIKNAPKPFNKEYANLLDYSHEKVRNYRLDIIFETIDRNKENIDGFELDFSRIQVLFPAGKAEIGAPLITAMLKKVREKLNANAKIQGRPMYLLARIPPSAEACKLAGLDIDTWMKEGLVDMVSPSQLMTLAQDMPVESIIAKAHQYKVKVYPTLMPKSNFRLAFKPSLPTLGLNLKSGSQIATLEEMVTAAVNYRQMGADGLYLFNYNIGTYPQDLYRLTAELNSKGISSVDKVFAVTKVYSNDNIQPSYSYTKQLPLKVGIANASLNIYVGELPTVSPYPLTKCLLRLGIRNAQSIPSVLLNGKPLEVLHIEDHTESPRITRVSDGAQKTVVYKINELSLIKIGRNKIEVTAENSTITDVEIAYGYMTNLSYMVRGVADTKFNQPITGIVAPTIKWNTSSTPTPKPKPKEEIEEEP